MTPNKGDKIKNLRIQNKMTLEEVGNRIGVSKQTLYKYENNIITNITSDKIEGLAKIFNVSPSRIMGWDDTPKEYYKDAEVAEFTEYLRTRPGARMLFSAAKDISKEDMEKAVEYIELLKLKHK